jgi:hypothetical protein
MSESARVNSVEALKQAKTAFIEFSDAVASALASIDADINRVSSWLNQDRPAHWKRQVRLREEAINKIKTDIMRKRIIAAPEPASVIEEEKALDRAKMLLGHAQSRQEAVRRWAPTWDREAMMYKTSTHQITEFMHRDIPVALARLDRMMTNLDEYTRIAAPTMDDRSPSEAVVDPAEGVTGEPDVKSRKESGE